MASVDFVTLLSLDPLNFPLLSLRSRCPIDLTITALFLVIGLVNRLITATPQCVHGRTPTPVLGWISTPVLPAMSAVDAEDDEDDVEEPMEPEVTSGVLPILGA